MIWYVWNTSGVVLNDNENGKMLGPHVLVCAHALGDTPLPFTLVWTRTLRGRKTIIMVIIMLRGPSRKTVIMFIIMLRRSSRKMIIMFNLMLP